MALTVLALAFALVATMASASFEHPGVFLSSSRLSTLRARLAAGVEPTTSFLAAAQASTPGSLKYVPFGPPATGIIECGSYDVPNIGCSNETSDADAAYLHALFFALGVEPVAQHAALSASILDLYARELRGYQGSNSPLQASWVVGKFTRAAELLASSPTSGWPAASSRAFSAWLYSVHLPLFYNCLPENGKCVLARVDVVECVRRRLRPPLSLSMEFPSIRCNSSRLIANVQRICCHQQLVLWRCRPFTFAPPPPLQLGPQRH